MVLQYFSLTFIAFTGSALAADFQQFPPCARPAFLRAASRSYCALSDTACICKTNELIEAFKDTLPQACPGEDFAKAYRVGCDLCPNLKTIFPSASNPILRLPATTNANSLFPSPEPHPEKKTTGPPPAKITIHDAVYDVPATETHTGLPEEKTPVPYNVNTDDDIDNDVPQVYSTPSHFAAAEPSGTIDPSQFTNTETWKYPTSTTKGLPKGSPSASTTQAPPVVGEAAKEVNWVRLLAVAVGVGALAIRVAGIMVE